MSGDNSDLYLYNKIKGGGNMINASVTGKKIAELRKEKGLTQKELAEKLHVTDKAISKWERGINFPELMVMENLAEELDVSVVELLSLEDASTKEAVKEVTQISIFEKEKVLQELRIRSYLKIIIEIAVFLCLIQASKIMDDYGIHGRGQMFTMGLLGFIGALVGMEIYTIRNLWSGVKSSIKVREWKWIEALLVSVAIVAVLIYLGIQFFLVMDRII